MAEPLSVRVMTGGTNAIPEDEDRAARARALRPASPGASSRPSKLIRPIYRKTASGGHFGRALPEFTWERTDKADALRKAAGLEAKPAAAKVG